VVEQEVLEPVLLFQRVLEDLVVVLPIMVVLDREIHHQYLHHKAVMVDLVVLVLLDMVAVVVAELVRQVDLDLLVQVVLEVTDLLLPLMEHQHIMPVEVVVES